MFYCPLPGGPDELLLLLKGSNVVLVAPCLLNLLEDVTVITLKLAQYHWENGSEHWIQDVLPCYHRMSFKQPHCHADGRLQIGTPCLVGCRLSICSNDIQ